MRRLLVLAFGALAVAVPGAAAATISVDTTADVVSNDSHCSLREAISSANADAPAPPSAGECATGSGADTIVLAAGPPYTLSGAARENANTSGDLDVTSAVTIQSAGASLTAIDANSVDRAIDVQASGNLTLRGVTITGGRAPDGLSAGTGGVGSTGPPAAPGGNAGATTGDPGESGGGIRNSGTLTVLDSVISNNRAGDGRNGGTGIGGIGGAGGRGGGIFSSGTLTLTRVVVTGNVAGNGGVGGVGTGGNGGLGVGSSGVGGYGGTGAGGSGGTGGSGAGVDTESGTVTIDASTIHANTAGAGGKGGLGQGGLGGITIAASGTGGLGGEGDGGTGGAGGSGAGIRAASTGAQQILHALIDENTAGLGGVGGTGNGTGGGASTAGSPGGTGGSGQGGTGGPGGSGAAVDGRGVVYTSDTITANVTGSGGAGGTSKGGTGGASSGVDGNGGPGGGGSGGAVGQGALVTAATTTIDHATITANSFGTAGSGTNGTPGNAGGGGASPGGSSNGSAGAGGAGGAVVVNATTTVMNSIVASNGAPACVNTPTDGGHNIIFNDLSCGPGLNADPLLQPLADNGGPTLTRKPTVGSPAIDLVPAGGAGCAATDQRLVLRPSGLGCDAGAYELAPPSLTVGGATGISLDSATLQGQVNPNAQASTFHFEYGTTTSYGSSTPQQDLPAGVDPVAVSAAITDLAPGTTYHLRLVGANADGDGVSPDQTFVTTAQPGGPGGGGGDTTAPVFQSASMKPKTFAVNRRGPAETLVAAKVKRGTTFRYRLSEAARVVFTIQRRKGKRFVQAKRFAKVSKAGANTKRFVGRIGKRALKPGRYRATLLATDAAGNRSKATRLKFRVVRAA